MNALINVRTMDWPTWFKGIARSVISGGAGAVGSGFGGILVDPVHFNTSGGVAHLLGLMGTTFGVVGVFRLAEFLQKHPIPDDFNPSTPEKP